MRKLSSIPKPCSFPACDRGSKTAGLCGGHYQQKKAGKALAPLRAHHDSQGNRLGGGCCSFEGCRHPQSVWGLCDGHYQQRKGGNPLIPLREIRADCVVVGCAEPHEAKGYCQSHYDKWRVHGDPLSGRQPVVIEDWESCLAVHLSGEHGEGKITLVSPEDRPLVEDKTWWCTEQGYVKCKQGDDHVLLHRLILGLEKGDPLQGDHINGEILDNRRENLRVVTFEQQMQNKKPWGKSGHRSVFFDEKKQLYRVVVVKDGKHHSGGRHKNLEDAIEAARLLREKLLTHHVEDRCSTPTSGEGRPPG